MTMTEEEAKTKQCQEGITQQPAAATGFAWMVPNCIGSACMAWRWFDNLSDEAIKDPRGFCGKAGHP